jgi:hypothetical protein
MVNFAPIKAKLIIETLTRKPLSFDEKDSYFLWFLFFMVSIFYGFYKDFKAALTARKYDANTFLKSLTMLMKINSLLYRPRQTKL